MKAIWKAAAAADNDDDRVPHQLEPVVVELSGFAPVASLGCPSKCLLPCLLMH